MNPLAKLFLSQIRAELMRLFFGVASRRMYRAQIIAEMDFAPRSVEEELEKLVRLELLHTTKDGNRRYYEVNRAHPLYPEFRGIVLKTVGLRDVLAEVLPVERVEFAFVFGSVASGTETASSDVDLMVVGTAGHRELASGLRSAGEQLGRELNPHFFTVDAFFSRLAANDHFLRDVMNKPKLFIVGGEREFADLAERRLAAVPPNQP